MHGAVTKPKWRAVEGTNKVPVPYKEAQCLGAQSKGCLLRGWVNLGPKFGQGEGDGWL